MNRSLSQAMSRYVTRLKGTEYTIDERISPTSLITITGERLLMRFRGILRFPFRRDRPFLGRRAVLRCSSNVKLGKGVTFGHGSFVDALSIEGVVLGSNTSLGRNTRIECTGTLRELGRGMEVGDDVGLGSDCLYGSAGGITIGNDTIVGNFVSMHSENHVIDDVTRPIRVQGVTHAGITVGCNCWIGAKVTVLDGAHIGDGCVVAAGSVVAAGDYPSNGVYGGVPARLLRRRM